MEETDLSEGGSRWLKGCAIGCGAGCGVMVLIVIVVATVGGLRIRSVFDEMRDAERSRAELVARLGEIEAWTPPAGGLPAAGRIERFVALRESLAGQRRDLEEAFAEFPPREVVEGELEGWRAALRVLAALGELAEPVGLYQDARNRALLHAEMPLGEYVWLYALVYHSWLGHPPDAGPVLPAEVRVEGEGRAHVFGEEDSPFSPGSTWRRYRRSQLALLGNLARSLSEPSTASADPSWARIVREEIRLLESRPRRVAWEDGLPPRLAGELEPWRGRLESTWSETANVLEIPGPREAS